MSKVLWEWIPNGGSKAREGAKAMSLAFVSLDFQHAGVRRIWCLFILCRHSERDIKIRTCLNRFNYD